MDNTEKIRYIGAVIKTLAGVDFDSSSGNRQPDCAFVDPRFKSVVTVEPFWSVPWKSHVALDVRNHTAPRTHTMNIACIPRNFPQEMPEASVDWNQHWAKHEAPQEKAQAEANN